MLVALFEESGEARVVLTRRSEQLRSHTGQVAFPGGRLDHGESPLAAALREATEEVGIDPGAVEILGQLAPLSTVSSASHLTPFVGALAGRPHLRPSPSEVARAFDVSLAELADEAVYREEIWGVADGIARRVQFFEVAGELVWGATARILLQLLTAVIVG